VLHEGQWKGQAIVDPKWLHLSLSPQSKGHQYYGTYGYQWWLKNLAQGPQIEDGGYNVKCGIGYGGQFLYLVPEWDLLAVFTGNMVGAEKFEVPQTIFKEQVLPLFQQQFNS
jgi:CubicO group peptidase (beta-lactamase class C family)